MRLALCAAAQRGFPVYVWIFLAFHCPNFLMQTQFPMTVSNVILTLHITRRPTSVGRDLMFPFATRTTKRYKPRSSCTICLELIRSVSCSCSCFGILAEMRSKQVFTRQVENPEKTFVGNLYTQCAHAVCCPPRTLLTSKNKHKQIYTYECFAERTTGFHLRHVNSSGTYTTGTKFAVVCRAKITKTRKVCRYFYQCCCWIFEQ